MTDTVVASVEPVIAPLPTPLSVEPRVAPAEAAEIARQSEEAKLPKSGEPKAIEPTKDKEPKPLSTREALRAAREKVEAEPATPLKTDPKAAENKEPVKADAKADAKDSAKTTETKEPAKESQVRGADGKFVSAEAAKAAEPVNEAAKEPAKEAPKPTEPAKPSFTAEPAPKRFAKVAQDRWAEAPEEVRSEVSRMEKELTTGFEKHRAAAARDADIAEFHERATKGGTTVKAALSAYVDMEDTLRNPQTRERGLEALFQNIGISPREWATKLLGQAPDAVATKADATILELRNEIAELKKGFGAIQQERTQAKTDSTTEAVTKFASDPAHSRFDELSEDIAFFLKTRCPGDLAEAYKLAERLNPAPVKAEPVVTVAPVVASSAPPAEVPKPTLAIVPASSAAGHKSIAGAPTAGSDPARKQPSSTIREALRRAQQRAV